jgi:hypothetical protein
MSKESKLVPKDPKGVFRLPIQVLCEPGLVKLDLSSKELVDLRGYSMHDGVHSWSCFESDWEYDLVKQHLIITSVRDRELLELDRCSGVNTKQ